MDVEQDSKTINQKLLKEILETCEHLSLIIISNQEHRFPHVSLNKVKRDAIFPVHFRRIVIQLFFLLYSCRLKKVIPLIILEDNYMKFNERRGAVYLHIKMLIPFQNNSFLQGQGLPYFSFFVRFIQSIKEDWEKAQDHTPVNYLFVEIKHILKNINLINQKYAKDDLQAFKAFETTEIVTECSPLKKIKYLSFLYNIKRSSFESARFVEHANRQQDYLKSLKNLSGSRNNAVLSNLQHNILVNLKTYLQSFQQNPTSNNISEEFYDKSRRQHKIVYDVIAPIQIEQFQEYFETQIQVRRIRNAKTLEFIVSYNRIKNIINIALFTGILFELSQSQEMIFKWNSLTFQSSQFTLESVDRCQNQEQGQRKLLSEKRRMKKYYSIRAICHLGAHEKIIQKTLILIDLMICVFKNIESQLRQQVIIQSLLPRLEEYTDRINHHTLLIGKACEKGYQQLKSKFKK